MENTGDLIEIDQIISKIYIIRNKRVMLDRDLAVLFGVETKQLKRAVRRNIKRFPKDFMFELSKVEFDVLRCQIDTSSWGGTRYPPFAFTEHGAVMLATVLNSEIADNMSVFVVRAFVALRQMLLTNEALAKRMEAIEKRVKTQDSAINSIVLTINQLLKPPPPIKRKEIKGFRP